MPELRSPCRGCHRELEDKSCPECTQCARRLEYVATLGGMTHSTPARHTIATGAAPDAKPQKRSNPVNTKPRTKICVSSCCEQAGRPQPIACFRRDRRTRDGYEQICHQCRLRAAAKEQKRSLKKKPMQKQTPQPKTPSNGQALTLDFVNHPAILESIQTIAKDEFRTPEQQILYLLSKNIIRPAVPADSNP